MKRPSCFSFLFLSLFIIGCSGKKKESPAAEVVSGRMESELVSDTIVDNTVLPDDTEKLPEVLLAEEEMMVSDYMDSLRHTTLNAIFWQRDSVEWELEHWCHSIDSIMQDYLAYEVEQNFKRDSAWSTEMITYCTDTFRMNQRTRFLSEHFYSTSDIVLVNYLNLYDNQQLQKQFIRKLGKTALTPELDMEITRELELWSELEMHERTNSENILLGDYIAGTVYQVLRAGILCDNAELASQSLASLYFSLSDPHYQIHTPEALKDSISQARNAVQKAYKRLRPLLNESDMLVLEEEEYILNQLIAQRNKIIARLPKDKRDIGRYSLFQILRNKEDHLVFFCEELASDPDSEEEEESKGV